MVFMTQGRIPRGMTGTRQRVPARSSSSGSSNRQSFNFGSRGGMAGLNFLLEGMDDEEKKKRLEAIRRKLAKGKK